MIKKMLAKLPWDKKYLKIAFHVIFALAVVYALTLILNFSAFALSSPGVVTGAVSRSVGWFGDVFAPVIIAVIIAYVLNPMADFFQKQADCFFSSLVLKYWNRHKLTEKDSGKKVHGTASERRVAGAALSYMSILLAFTALTSAMVMKIGTDEGRLESLLVGVMAALNGLQDLMAQIELKLMEWGAADVFSSYITDIVSEIGGALAKGASGMTRSLSSAGGRFMDVFLGAVIAFYLIMDKNIIKTKMSKAMRLILPAQTDKGLKRFFIKADHIFSGYIRGVLTDACIVGALVSILLLVLGVQYAVVIGIVSGASTVVPYVGALVAFVLAVLAALVEGDIMKAVLAAAGILTIQQLDSMFIQPKVVGVNVKMGPALVLASLYVFGKLFGLAGMVLAVPVCAVGKMLLEDYFKELEESNKSS